MKLRNNAAQSGALPDAGPAGGRTIPVAQTPKLSHSRTAHAYFGARLAASSCHIVTDWMR
jgi:hypothetical protein